MASDPTLPLCTLDPVIPSLAMKIAICISTQFGLPVDKIQPHLQQASLKQFGKVWHLDEGDIMNAPELVPVGNDCWDATFVHVSVSPPYHDYLSHIMVSMRCSLIRMYGTQTDQWYSNQQFSLVNYKIFLWLAWKHLWHSSLTKKQTLFWLQSACVSTQKSKVRMFYYSQEGHLKVVNIGCVQCLVGW